MRVLNKTHDILVGLMTKCEAKADGFFYQLKHMLPHIHHGQGLLILQPAVNECRVSELVTLDAFAVIHIVINALGCSHFSMPNAGLNETSVYNKTRLHTHLLHFVENTQRLFKVSLLSINLDQDAERYIAWLDFFSDHISIDHEADIDEADTAAAVQERIKKHFVRLNLDSLHILKKNQGSLNVSNLAKALDHRTVSN